MEKLQQYIIDWNSTEGLKPCNEDIFVDEFLNLICSDIDHRDFTFDGEGAYFGKQVTLHWNSGVWVGDPLIYFEIAYSKDQIRVYKANNDGFWTPEYLNMTSDHLRFVEVRLCLFKILSEVFGLPYYTD